MAEKLTYEQLEQRVEELEKQVVDLKAAYEQIRENFQGILSAIGDGVDITTHDYRVVYANDNLKRIVGKDELEGHLCYRVFLDRDTPCERCPMRRAIQSGRTETEEISQPNERVVEVSASPLTLPSGEIAAIEIAKDITERKRMEKALRSALEELEQRVQERTHDLRLANEKLQSEITERKRAEAKLTIHADKLERSNEELKQLVYIVSHDLQEPLATMSSYMRLLARRYTGKLDSDADRWINYVAKESNRVQQLSRALLKRAHVSPSGKKVEPIDFEALLDRTLVSLETVIADSGAQITHDPLPTVMADELQMEEVFQNLIRNALKFRSTAAPRIHVSAERNESEWVFSVQDNGLGMDPEFTKRIFSVFHRIPTKGGYPGEGIGLAICRKIVENHGGRIWVESEPGKGSTFYFTIPSAGA